MREILFRGKRIDNGEWVYDSMIDSGNHEQVCIYPWIDGASTMSVRQLVCARMVAVEPETVGLFTGFFDKNGKRIFEGDIIHASVDWCLCGLYEDVNLRVLYDTEVGGFDWLGIKMETAEVIGNIHDNPELLEEEE